jgi:hypothetical protein
VTRLHSLANRRGDFLIPNQRICPYLPRGFKLPCRLSSQIRRRNRQRLRATTGRGAVGAPVAVAMPIWICALRKFWLIGGLGVVPGFQGANSIPSNVPLVWPSRTRNSLATLTPLCACHTIRSCFHQDRGHKRKTRRPAASFLRETRAQSKHRAPALPFPVG